MRPAWLFYFILVFIFFPVTFFTTPATGIDCSWNIALSLAHRYHLTFGRDIVFPHGPLGFLHARLPIALDAWVYLLFDAYLVASLVFALRTLFREHFTCGVVLFVALGIAFPQYEAREQWVFLFFIFDLFCFVRGVAGREGGVRVR